MATKASRIALAGSNISSTGEVDADLLDNIDSAAFLSLDGNSRLGIGETSPLGKLHVKDGDAGSITTNGAHDTVVIEGSDNTGINIFSPNTSYQYLAFGDTEGSNSGYVRYQHSNNQMVLRAGASDTVYINDGNVGIGNGTSDPQFKLHVNKGSNNYAPSAGVDENLVGFTTSYDAVGSQTLTFSNLNGNWLDGHTGSDSAFGWLWNFGNEVRGGMVYDHRGTEQFQIFSSYAPIVFYTPDAVDGNGVPTDSNMNQRMTIMPGGNVGIGTTSPLAMLDIKGNTTTYDGMAKIYLTDSNSNSNSRNWSIGNGGSAFGNLTFAVSAAKDGVAGDGTSVNAMVIDNTGDVGIGTNSPGAKLDVRGSMNLRRDNGLLFFTDDNTAGSTNVNGGFIGMAHTAGYHVTSGDGGFGSNANSLLIGNYHTGGGDIILATTNAGPYASGRVIIKEGGNVGIGTDNPERPLTIKGGGENLRLTNSAATDAHTDFYIDGNEFSIRIDDDDVRNDSVFTLDIDAIERMRVSDNGDMAIGSTTAFSRLFVKGDSNSTRNLSTFATSNTGGSYPDIDTASIYLGSNNGRSAVAGNYIAGIAFDHLLNHSVSGPFNYGQNPHGWIGLKMWDFPGYERSSLVFATRPNTTSASEKTIERMEITPFGNVGINRSTPPATLTVNGTQRIEIDSNPSGLYSVNSDMHRDGAIIFPVTASVTTQTTAAGSGWANMGWATTSRSGEVMHRNTTDRYANGGSGTAMGFYLEAGTGEAGGICLDEDSVQVYGSSDNGTTFRIIDKDSDIVIMEMLQTSWNMSVRGSVNSSQSSFSGLSDRRVKKSFQDVSTENILTKYNNLDLKSYIRIDSYDYMKNNYENEEDLREVGLVAQEVEEIFPDVVGTTPVVDPRGMDSVWEELGEELTEIKNINQTGLLYKTIEAVQALIEENTALKARLDALEE